MTTDSFKKRYLSKLSANIVGLGVNLVTQAIIPRGLGPRAYGDFNFLSNFFNQVVGFLDMGTSIGFYTKLSQRQQEFGLVSFYLSFMGIVSFLLLIITGFIIVSGTYTSLLPDQVPFFIYLSVIWGILTWCEQVLNKMADAYGVTVSAEIAKIIQKGLGLGLIGLLFMTGKLNLTNYYFYHYIILVFLLMAYIFVMERSEYSFRQEWKPSLSQIRKYTSEFYNYSHPLFVYALVVMIVGILERWMLQKYSGSVQQGFYGLSYLIGTVFFLFTSAMTPIITREFSISYGKNDINEMERLFRRYIPTLYVIAAYFGCFIAVEAEKVTFILGGEKFQQAALAVSIMAFYPIHGTYGQLSGSIFYASGQTALYRNIGIIFTLIGLMVTYFLIAPRHMMGLNAGATGLAVKMVSVNIFRVNVHLWFNAKLLKLRFWRYVLHQIVSVGCLLGIASISMFIVDQIVGLHDKIIAGFILSGLLYTFMAFILCYVQPVIFGLQRQDIHSVFQLIISKIR